MRIDREHPGAPGHGVVVCDAPDCGVEQPPAGEVLRGGGLIGLGWHCSGGKHLCPAHHPDREIGS